MPILELDTPFAKQIGFTSDLFGGYLWKDENIITISIISSKEPNKGHFQRFLDNLISKGYSIKVPTSSQIMAYICSKRGFKYKREICEVLGEVEVLYKE